MEANEAPSMTYSYCPDDEEGVFYGYYNTPEEAAAAAFQDDPALELVDVGENHRHPASRYVPADWIIADIVSSAYDDCGERADDWLSDIMRDREKLDELRQLIGAWLDRHDPPTFCAIENIRTITRDEIIAAGLPAAQPPSPQ